MTRPINHDSLDYDAFFAQKIQDLKDEGRYRVFANLARRAGDYPRARRFDANGVALPDVTVCVRRQIIWDRWGCKLMEGWPHLVG